MLLVPTEFVCLGPTNKSGLCHLLRNVRNEFGGARKSGAREECTFAFLVPGNP